MRFCKSPISANSAQARAIYTIRANKNRSGGQGAVNSKPLLGKPLAPASHNLLAPVAKLLGQALQTTAAENSTGGRIHVILHLLHALRKMVGCFVELV